MSNDDEDYSSSASEESDGRGSSYNGAARRDSHTPDPRRPPVDVNSVRRDFFMFFYLDWKKHYEPNLKILEFEDHNQLKDHDLKQKMKDLRVAVRKCIDADPIHQDNKVRTQEPPIEPTFLHDIVASSTLEPAQKRFLFRIALESEPSRIFVQSIHDSESQTPLHIAVKRENIWLPSKRDVNKVEPNVLIRSICESLSKNLPKEDVAKVIAIKNSKGETCVHIAIERDIIGLQDLISLADRACLIQRRGGEGNTRENTPLHDALSFKFYELRTLNCFKEGKESYATNKNGAENTPLSTPSGGISTNITATSGSVCELCKKTVKYNKRIRRRREEIIEKLIDLCPDALRMHNAAGLSPYLYHLMTRQEVSISGEASVKKTEYDMSSANGNQPDTPTIQAPDDLRPGDADQQGRAPRRSATMRQDEQRDRTSRKIPTACKGPFRVEYSFSDEILTHLRENIFALQNSYRDVYLCLFSNNVQTNPTQHSWQPSRRISWNTKDNYDFLSFEPIMAMLQIHLTWDSWTNVPESEQEKKKQIQRDEVALIDFFTWLKEKKKVKSIVKLVMRENPEALCNEKTIRQCLKDLDVRYLDWDRPDLSLDTIKCVRNVTELCLYSSGLNAVFCSWSDEHGLKALTKLRKVIICNSKGFESTEANQENFDKFKMRLKNLYSNDPAKSPEIIDNFKSDPGPSSKPQLDGQIAQEEERLHPWFKRIKEFTGTLSNADNNKGLSDSDYIKVALIDDGVDPDFSGLGRFLSPCGWPPSPTLDYDSNGCERLLPSCFTPGKAQHGNQMAFLITKACPFARIFVAKVDVQDHHHELSHPSFNVSRAVEAIEWAVQQKVDIISMSWNVQSSLADEDIKALRSAVITAGDQNILMFSAASDTQATSSSKEPYHPGSFPGVIAIGAADWDRNKKPYVGSDAKFLFPGDYILYGSDNKVQKEGGNSAATALASGLAALILFCMKRDKQKISKDIGDKMANLFSTLARTQDGQFVEIRDLVGGAQETGNEWRTLQEVATFCKPTLSIAEGKEKSKRKPRDPTQTEK